MPQLPGLPIILPEYANIGGMFQTTAPLPAIVNGAGGSASFIAEGNFIVVPLAVFTQYRASGTVGTRILYLQVSDQNANLTLSVPAASTQSASSAKWYQWLWNASAVSSLDVGNVSPLPPLTLLPHWQLKIFVSSGQPGDMFDFTSATLAFIPTMGTTDLQAAVPKLPTPLLV